MSGFPTLPSRRAFGPIKDNKGNVAIAAINELVRDAGKPEWDWKAPAKDEALIAKVTAVADLERMLSLRSTGGWRPPIVTTVAEGTVPMPSYSAGPKVDDLQREEAWGSREAAGLPAEFELTDELKAKLTEARRKAWITRRKKYGRKGHAGSYSR